MQFSSNGLVFFIVATTIIFLLLAIFIVGILFLYQNKQIAYLKEIDTIKSEFERNLMSAQLEIREQIFQNISREIHDHICLNLTLAKLNLVTIDHTNIHQIVDHVNSSIDILGKSIYELSDLSHSMNSDIIQSNGLITALELEVKKMEKLNLFQIRVTISGHTVYMDSLKELFIFRIAQEAFNNILKHAKAKNVLLSLYYDTDHIEVLIQDDGQGFLCVDGSESSSPKYHAGLKNMKKRSELINGSCEILSDPDKGTKIKLSVPY